jgi:hypothetical protein
MKRFAFILISAIFSLSVAGQVQQEVISSASGYNTKGNLSVSWTLGEIIIPTYKNGNLSLASGIQQQLKASTIKEKQDMPVDLKIYPNPVSEYINIQFEEPVEWEVPVSVLDSQGRVIKSDVVESTMLQKIINIQDLPAGLYYLRLTRGKLVNIYKVVKL